MTPARSKRNSSSSKPYTKGIARLVLSSSVLDLTTNAQADTPGSPSPNNNSPSIPVERPGFPTYAQYKKVEAAYIQSLTPRRQGKALISQALFDRVWDVLTEPDYQGETPQFRFWARKMFTLSKTHRSTLNPFDDDPPEEVLLHDNLLVAVQEQLYDLLCYCHGSTGHGGRDKTCTLIRQHYTWVPKDLVSGFIKACPTCIMKKCGNLDSVLASRITKRKEDVNISADPKSPGSSDDGATSGATPALPVSSPTLATPGDSPSLEMEEFDLIETAYREAVQRARSMKASLSAMAVAHPQGVPMTREVSLYKGLPNGWQYRHSNYASAYAEFMKNKGLGLFEDDASDASSERPRVPSILPLWVPDRFIVEEEEEEEYSVQDTNLCDSYSSLQYLFGHSQQSLASFKEDPQPFQIDPMALRRAPGSASQIPSNASSTKTDEKGSNHATYANSTSVKVPMSLKRAAAPPRLELDFLAYRAGLREADVTPDGSLTGINWDTFDPSPTRSDSSSPFHASQFAPPLSATASVSPPGSALRTPEDESPNETNEGGHLDFRMIKGGTKVEAVEIELSDGIQQVCGL